MVEFDVREAHEANRVAWNDGAARYTEELDRSIEFLRSGGISLHRLEREHFGDLAAWCDTAIHLQCASGEDTLSLLNAGVRRVIGVDISEVHIANARAAATALDLNAQFVRCDVLDVPAELNGTADLVHTGQGALVWIHDLTGWARVVARLLRPGGMFHVLDDHPAAFLFDQDFAELRPSGADYFHHTIRTRGWTAEYIGDLGKPLDAHPTKFERFWTLSEMFTALTAAGLVVTQFGEHPDEYWRSFPLLDDETRARLPMTFSMTARKPDASSPEPAHR